MSWTSLLGAGLGLFGQSQASDAAGDAAQAQVTSSAIAAEAAKFKPYGVTTGFGSSWFDPESSTAGYDLDPALAAYRDKLMMMGVEGLPQDLSGTAQDRGLQYQQELGAYGGQAADMANLYGGMANAAAANAPTNVGGAYAGITGPNYANTAQGIANQYTQAGSDLLGQGTASAGDLYEQIRDLQRPGEDRARSQMEQGLYGSGRLGMKMAQYGGTPEQMAFEKALGESRNQAAYQAIGQADQLAASQRQQAMGMSQMGLGASNAYNQMLGQGFQDQMGLAGANLGAQQAQAQLASNYGQFGMGADAQRIQQAMAMRGAGTSELDASIARGTGLFTSGMGIEQLGMTPLQVGAELGGRTSTAGANVGNALLQGGMGAAQANLAGGLGWANTMGDMGLGLMKYGGK